MADETLNGIIKLCAATDIKTSQIYGVFAGLPSGGELRVFWEEMKAKEEGRARKWQQLLRLLEQKPLPNVFDDPEHVLAELRDLDMAAEVLLKLGRTLRDNTKALLLACRMECYLLHPAFETLSRLYSIEAGEKPTQEAVDDSLSRLVGKLREHAVLSPETELLAELMGRLWSQNREMSARLATITVLNGLLPICAACKKIRDGHGKWTEIELYISRHSDADFTHSICPDCTRKLYPEVAFPENPPG